METEPEKTAGQETATQAISVDIRPEILAQQQRNLERVAPSGIVHYFTPYDMVASFHAASMLRGLCAIGEINKPVEEAVVKGRIDLIDEEVNKELLPLLQKIAENGGKASLEQKAELLDHLVDSVYVLMGAAANFGLFFDTGFAIVHKANMAKVMRPEGPIFFEEGNPEGQPVGKVKKPEGWTAPNKQLFELCLGAFSHAEMSRPEKATNLKPAIIVPEGTTAALDQSPEQQ